MIHKRVHSFLQFLLFLLLSLLLLIACNDILYDPDIGPSFSGNPPYWTCITATPIPTEQFMIGVDGTPAPDATPMFGWTTPVPTETPQYSVEEFYLGQAVHMSGFIITFEDYNKALLPPDHPNNEMDDKEQAVYKLRFSVESHVAHPQIIPLSDLLFIRNIVDESGEILIGRWGARQTSQENAQESIPLAPKSSRVYEVSLYGPNGTPQEFVMTTNWRGGLEGGVPVYFLPEQYPANCEHGSALWDNGPPPPPTPHIIGLTSWSSSGTGICGQPAAGTITRKWGCSAVNTGIRGNGCSGTTPWHHNGWDIANTEGTSIYSPVPGSVSYADWIDTGYGNLVVVQSDSERHFLGHLQDGGFSVYLGQSVEAGQEVGLMGSTGNSTGPHVHWTIKEVHRNVSFDPATWTGCLAFQATVEATEP